MGAYICYMSVRLVAMKRLLKPTGSIYLHCDHSASHYLKAAMDCIFGRLRFINEITWLRNKNPKGTTKSFPKNTDSILVYSKSEKYTWHVQRHKLTEEQKAAYKLRCPRTNKPMKLGDLTAPAGAIRPNLRYPLMGITRTWMWEEPRMKQAVKDGLVIQTKKGNVPRRVLYLDEAEGNAIDNNWSDIEALHSKSSERWDYPTQKPLLLYERMIKTSSNKEDLVLDPFCGCATAVLAAERLKRSWIGIDIWDKSKTAVLDRMARLGIMQEDDIRSGLVDNKLILSSELPSKSKKPSPPEREMSNKEMKNILIERHGLICQGCFHSFPFAEHFELDHIRPRKDGGRNELDNRTLLCSACNRRKSHKLTLSGLQALNKEKGYMAQSPS